MNTPDTANNETLARRAFSRLALALCVIYVVGSGSQMLFMYAVRRLTDASHPLQGQLGIWVGTIVPLYLVSLPLAYLILRTVPTDAPPAGKLPVSGFFKFLLMSFVVMYTGNIIGTVLSMVLSRGGATNMVAQLAMSKDYQWLKFLVLCVVGPFMEELVFRKLLIDRTRDYGEKYAMIFSAVAFGLFHGNFFQFFYATGLGLLLAYIYLRTGKLRYIWILHGVINFWGSFVPMFFLSGFGEHAESLGSGNYLETIKTLTALENNPEFAIAMLGMMVLGLAVVGLMVGGAIMLALYWKRFYFMPMPQQLARGRFVPVAYLNVGAILFLLLMLVVMVSSIVM